MLAQLELEGRSSVHYLGMEAPTFTLELQVVQAKKEHDVNLWFGSSFTLGAGCAHLRFVVSVLSPALLLGMSNVCDTGRTKHIVITLFRAGRGGAASFWLQKFSCFHGAPPGGGIILCIFLHGWAVSKAWPLFAKKWKTRVHGEYWRFVCFVKQHSGSQQDMGGQAWVLQGLPTKKNQQTSTNVYLKDPGSSWPNIFWRSLPCRLFSPAFSQTVEVGLPQFIWLSTHTMSWRKAFEPSTY